MVKTSTISLRVPSDFKDSIMALCKNKDVSITNYVMTCLTPSTDVAPINAKVLEKLRNGGDLSINKFDKSFNIPSPEFIDTLSITGGAFVGLIVYNSLSNYLGDKNKFTEEQIEIISISAGIASAFLTGFGANKAFGSKK